METHLTETERRIPRPTGSTNLNLIGRTKDLYSKLSREYLRGNFPRPGTNLSMEQFIYLYHIPRNVIKSEIRNSVALSPELLLKQGKDLVERILDITSDPMIKTQRLTRFLEDKIYSGSKVSHLLVQQLVSSLSLEQKASVDLVRLVQGMMNTDFVVEQANEGFLDHEEALKVIASEIRRGTSDVLPSGHRDTGIKDLSAMESQLKEEKLDPDTVIIDLQGKKLKRVSEPAVHDYAKLKEAAKPKMNHPPSILPV